MQRILRNRFYYLVFAGTFFLFWFLFKVGGMINVPKALLSAAADVCIGMTALLLTAEWLLPKLVYQKKYRLFTACYLTLIFLAGTAIILLQLKLAGSSLSSYHKDLAKYQQHYFYWFWADLIFGSYFLVFLISAVGAAIRFAFDRMKALNRIEVLEKEKIQAELDLLKNQVNPHFLFNALNTIYYKIERSNQAARQTLQRFSEMLRYQLYECDKPTIPIEQELEFLSSYIDLQKERMNSSCRIDCKGFGEVKGFAIAPFLLMPIIENCFKHVSGQSKNGSHLLIECSKENGHFLLTTLNSIGPSAGNKKEGGGIGMKNIQKRLQLLYPEKHELHIQKTNESFELKLKINLQ